MSTYYVAGFPYSSELYHHGIKGQKWGVRRFQNLDRSYTAAGKERYGRDKSDGGRGLSDKTKNNIKKAAKVAAVAAGAGLAAYGAYKFAGSDTGKRIISNVGNAARERIGNTKNTLRERVNVRKARKDILKKAARIDLMNPGELDKFIGEISKKKKAVELTRDYLVSNPNPTDQLLIDSGRKIIAAALVGAGSYTASYAVTRKHDKEKLASYAFPNPNKKKQ